MKNENKQKSDNINASSQKKEIDSNMDIDNLNDLSEINENILKVLLDENDESPITLYNEKDCPIKFDQIAIIPLEEKIYAILKPLDEIEGVAEDEAIVFFVDEKAEIDSQLVVETDESISMKVFDEYYKLLEKDID